MSESDNKKQKNPNFAIRHPVLSTVLAAGTIGATIFATNELTNDGADVREAMRQAAEQIKSSSTDPDLGKKVGDALSEMDERNKAAKVDTDAKFDGVKTGIDALKTALEASDKKSDDGRKAISKKLDKAAEERKKAAEERKAGSARMDAAEEAARKIRAKVAAHRAGVSYEQDYLNDFSLTRKKSVDGEVITLFNADGKALRKLELANHSPDELEIVHRRWHNKDDDADGNLDYDGQHGGLFVDRTGGISDATGVKTELEQVVKLLEETTSKHTNADEIYAAAKKVYDNSDKEFQVADKAHKETVKAYETAVKAVEDQTTLITNNDNFYKEAVKAIEEASAAGDDDKLKEAQKKRDEFAKAKTEAEEAKVKAEEAKTKAQEVVKKAKEVSETAEKARKKADEDAKSKKNGRTSAEEDFKKLIERFEKIGKNPTYGLMDSEARTLVDLFKEAGTDGKYLGLKSISTSGDELGLPVVAIKKNAANNYTILASIEDPVKELIVEKIGRSNARVRLVKYTHSGVKVKKSKEMTLDDLKTLIGKDGEAGKSYAVYEGAKSTLQEVVVDSVTADKAKVTITTYQPGSKKTEKVHTISHSELRKMFDSPKAGKSYRMFSEGAHVLGDVKIEDHATKRDYKKVTVKRGGHDFEYEIPTTYVDEMVNAWEKAYLTGKGDVLKLDAGMTSISKAIVSLENEIARNESLSNEHGRGLQWQGVFDEDGKTVSNTLRIAGGGKDHDYSAEGYQESNSTDVDGDITERTVENLNLDFNFRLGTTPTIGKTDNRKKFKLSLFAQGDSESSEFAAEDPVVSIDGQYETTTTDNGGSEDRSKRDYSIGIYSVEDAERFIRAGILFGSDKASWNRDIAVAIRDLSGTNPDINNNILVDGSTEDDHFGFSLTCGLQGLSSDHVFIPTFKTVSGTIVTNDGVNPDTEMDYSGLDLGVLYRNVGSDDVKLTLGGIYTSGEIDGVDYDESDFSLNLPFTLGKNLAMGVNAGYKSGSRSVDGVTEDTGLWRGGIAFAAGGKGTSSNSVDALDQYEMAGKLDEMSGQYTSEAMEIRNKWRRMGMLQGLDANLLLSLDAEQMYDENGELATVVEGSFALMNQLSGNRKFILDLTYTNDGFGEGYGVELGYLSKGLISVGYKHTEGDDNQEDKKELTGSATFRF